VLRWWVYIQEFQYGKFAVYGHEELLQTRNRHTKIDELHAITILECKHYSLFIIRSDLVILVVVIDNEW